MKIGQKAKRIAHAVLYPHAAIMIVLLPLATVLMVFSMLFQGTDSPTSIVSYALSFYTLLVWCMRIPDLVRYIKNFKKRNKYALRWSTDPRLRVTVSLYGTLIWNTAYALLQLALGFQFHTFWYYSMAAYYICLAIMRFFLLNHTRKFGAGENMEKELSKYRLCGIIFLIMNLSISVIIFMLVFGGRTFKHHPIIAIAMAAYTFTSLTVAIVNVFRYRKYNSPVYSASKAISLTSACVSMMTLEATFLTTFDSGKMTAAEIQLMLGMTGGAVSALIVVMAIYMIIRSTKQIQYYKPITENTTDAEQH